MRTKPAQQLSFIWLDVARSLAALAVLLGHLRAFVFWDSVQSNHLSPLWKAFYFFTSIQHQAVVVFFVLSGFLITRSISEDTARGHWSWYLYSLKRLSRLWIVLLPALILTAIWDQLGIHITGSQLYSGGLNAVNHSTPFGALTFSVWSLLGNAAFLQGIVVPAFGTDTPLWSLADEFWYYVAFPLFFLASRRGCNRGVRFAYLSGGLAICFCLQPAQRYLGLVWLLGYAAYWMYRKRSGGRDKAKNVGVIMAAVVFVGVIFCSKVFKIDDVVQDFITGISFAFLVAQFAGIGAPAVIAKPARFFASFSFTLYVVHFPFLAFATSILFHNERLAPSLTGLTKFVFLFMLTLCYAFVVAFAFERNTSTIQSKIRDWVSRPAINRGVATVPLYHE